MGRRLTIWVLILSLSAPATWAQDPSPAPPPADPLELAKSDGYVSRPDDLKPGSLMGGTLAIFPGAVFHGAGHLYTGDTAIGLGLFAAELLGIALMAGGYYLNESTSGSPEFSIAQQLLSHAGFMLFAGSWAADTVGSFKGSAPFDEGPLLRHRRTFGVAYRYVNSPLNDFQHHANLSLEANRGRFFVRPSIDLEIGLARREFRLETGGILLGADRSRNHLLLGLNLERLENRTDGWAQQSGVSYLQAKVDLGRFISTLKRFYVVNRIGYGVGVMQFSDRRGDVPAILSEGELTDSWLYLETGASVHIGEKTNVVVSVREDPQGVIAPGQVIEFLGSSPELESLHVGLFHQYDDDIAINVNVTTGDGLGVWIGLEYGQ